MRWSRLESRRRVRFRRNARRHVARSRDRAEPHARRHGPAAGRGPAGARLDRRRRAEAARERAARERARARAARAALRALPRSLRSLLSRHHGALPGIAECLARLGHESLAVLSNKPARFLDRIIDGLGIKGVFAAVLGGDTLPVRKPDPAVLAGVIERTRRAPPRDLDDRRQRRRRGDRPRRRARARSAAAGACAGATSCAPRGSSSCSSTRTRNPAAVLG